jgi:hypothetical protein
LQTRPRLFLIELARLDGTPRFAGRLSDCFSGCSWDCFSGLFTDRSTDSLSLWALAVWAARANTDMYGNKQLDVFQGRTVLQVHGSKPVYRNVDDAMNAPHSQGQWVYVINSSLLTNPIFIRSKSTVRAAKEALLAVGGSVRSTRRDLAKWQHIDRNVPNDHEIPTHTPELVFTNLEDARRDCPSNLRIWAVEVPELENGLWFVRARDHDSAALTLLKVYGGMAAKVGPGDAKYWRKP